MKNILVIYHRADFDGKFSREIAKKYFGDRADYLGWDYGDPVPFVELNVHVVMLDISVDGLMDHPMLTWIDHHKSAITKYPRDIAGLRIDGVAACRLAWQWFFGAAGAPMEAYIERAVEEPYAVRLAGEYDIWDKRDPNAEIFQHGLRSCDLELLWKELLDPERSKWASEFLLSRGEPVQHAMAKQDESIIKGNGFTIVFEGLVFLAVNAARYNSHLFRAGLTPEHDGCFGFRWDGKKWRVSLYGVPGKPDIDFSVIAAKYGGGGHKQACGFECRSLPPAVFPKGPFVINEKDGDDMGMMFETLEEAEAAARDCGRDEQVTFEVFNCVPATDADRELFEDSESVDVTAPNWWANLWVPAEVVRHVVIAPTVKSA